MQGLVLLIFVTIVSGLLAQYLYDYPGEISFIYLYTYFFGTFLVIGFFLLCMLSLFIYAYALKNSKSSTHKEIVYSKIVVWSMSVMFIISIVFYFVSLSKLSTDEYKIEQYLEVYGNN